MFADCVRNRNETIRVAVSGQSAPSPRLCTAGNIIIIQLPAVVGGSEAVPTLDSAVT